MTKVPDYIKENIYQTVKRDLEPSRWVVHAKVATAVAVGGGSSLFLCGQMGLGLSPLAETVHGLLMHYGGFWGCTVVCGVLFAILPVVLLKILSSKLQYLVLLRHEWRAIFGWLMAFGCYLVFRNQQTEVTLTLVLWVTPAFMSFYALGWLVYWLTHSCHIRDFIRKEFYL